MAFANGFTRSFTGGFCNSVAACPQFVCLGPMYHLYASMFGSQGAVALASLTESLIAHGPEKRNAQLAINTKCRTIPVHRIQNPFMPFGHGFGIHFTRNV